MLLVWNMLVLSNSHFRVMMIDKLLASEVLDPSLIHPVQLQNKEEITTISNMKGNFSKE